MRKTQKTTLILAILFVGAFMAPSMATVNAQSDNFGIEQSFKQLDASMLAESPALVGRLFGALFGMLGGTGSAGSALGQVFSLIFSNILNLTVSDNLVEDVYVLNASYTMTDTWTETLNKDEIRWIPGNYELEGDQEGDGWPYVRIERSGSATITHEYGAAVVLLMWDSDASFITAIRKVITAAQEVGNTIKNAGDPEGWTEEQAQQVISSIVGSLINAALYLVIHINDIINGDELIVCNVITWDTYQMNTSTDYSSTKEVLIWNNWNLGDDVAVYGSTITNWQTQANTNDDAYMKWMLNNLGGEAGEKNVQWSTYSFNLVELWLKNFEIHINVSAIVDVLLDIGGSFGVLQMGGNPFESMGFAQIFQGLDIEIYLMTHTLLGFIAYDDVNADMVPTVEWENTTIGGEAAEVISDSEAQFYFAIGSIGSIKFNQPEAVIYEGLPSVKWSIEFVGLQMAAIPIQWDPRDVSVIMENVEFLEMGFTFTPRNNVVESTAEYDTINGGDVVMMGKGNIKLDQYFGEWNSGAGPNNPDLVGLDFAVVFISTIIHVHLNVEVMAETPETQQGLMNNTEITSNGELKIGNEAGTLPVAAVDIVGPKYNQTDALDVVTTHDAQTTTIPLAFLNFNAQANVQYIDTTNPVNSFSATGVLNIEASAMIYAVSYPTWNGSGDELWHDPTFSVFMTWDNPGFWAVILVVGGVTLVAVAAIMITKKKNRV